MSTGLKIVIASPQKHWHTHLMFYVMYVPDGGQYELPKHVATLNRIKVLY
jgi:hypothetical protein